MALLDLDISIGFLSISRKQKQSLIGRLWSLLKMAWSAQLIGSNEILSEASVAPADGVIGNNTADAFFDFIFG
jgi:hypothetical protein